VTRPLTMPTDPQGLLSFACGATIPVRGEFTARRLGVLDTAAGATLVRPKASDGTPMDCSRCPASQRKSGRKAERVLPMPRVIVTCRVTYTRGVDDAR